MRESEKNDLWESERQQVARNLEGFKVAIKDL